MMIVCICSVSTLLYVTLIQWYIKCLLTQILGWEVHWFLNDAHYLALVDKRSQRIQYNRNVPGLIPALGPFEACQTYISLFYTVLCQIKAKKATQKKVGPISQHIFLKIHCTLRNLLSIKAGGKHLGIKEETFPHLQRDWELSQRLKLCIDPGPRKFPYSLTAESPESRNGEKGFAFLMMDYM